MDRLSGKVAIITGGASGIGAACVRKFVSEGARVLLTDLNAAAGAALAADLGDAAAFVEHDVCDPAGWARAVEAAEDKFGPVTILVNNAGITYVNAIEQTTKEAFQKVLDVNVIGGFLGMQAVVGSMRRAGAGSIVNISSAAGLVGSPLSIAYTASKFAARGMTKTAAAEFAAWGIRVNSVHPGVTDTPMIMTDEATRAIMAEYIKAIPLGRVADPSEIANLVLYLGSDDSSYSTGSEFVVDAGQTML